MRVGLTFSFLLVAANAFAQLGGSIITTVAGTGVQGFSGDGGPATSAQVSPMGVAVDEAGNLYIADLFSNRIRKVDSTGTITTVAGTGTSGYSGDGGPATAAQLLEVWSVAVDAKGNLFIGHKGAVRKVTPDGIIRTVAGNGIVGFSGDGGPATSAQITVAQSIAVDTVGNLYIADTNNARVRKVDVAGIITTVAGTGTPGFSGDGSPAVSAQLNIPFAVAVDAKGNLYIATYSDSRIRKVSGKSDNYAEGIITTFFGGGQCWFFCHPWGIAVNSFGTVFVSDTENSRVLAAPSATVIAGTGNPGYSGDGGSARSAQLYSPVGIAVDQAGNIFIADPAANRVRKVRFVNLTGITPSTIARGGTLNVTLSGSGFLSPLTINAGAGITFSNLTVTSSRSATATLTASSDAPLGAHYFAVNSAGAIISTSLPFYVMVLPAPIFTGISPNVGAQGGVLDVTFTGDPGYSNRTVDADPGIVISRNNSGRYTVVIAPDAALGDHNVTVTSDGAVSAPLVFTVLPPPALTSISPSVGVQGTSVAVTLTGNNFVSPATVTGVFTGDGGPALGAEIAPISIAVDGAGNLFIADGCVSGCVSPAGRNRVRMVSPTGLISTVAGNGSGRFSGDGGPALAAGLINPTSVALDASGNLFIADQPSNRIRKVSPDGLISTVAGNGTYGFSGDGGPATAAQLDSPKSIAIDISGNLYIADTFNFRIRKVTPDGVITTFAGNGIRDSHGDGGPAVSAGFNGPAAVAVGKDGSLFIADYYVSGFSSGNRIGGVTIREVNPDGIINTVAGTGWAGFSGDDGPAVSAQLSTYVGGLAVDAAGSLLIADTYNSRIRKVDSGGIIRTIAGNGKFGFGGDGGPAVAATLGHPIAVAVGTAGDLLIADSNSSLEATGRIRSVNPSGVINTLGGTGTVGTAIGVNNVTIGSPFLATATVYISDRATFGPHNISVTTAGVVTNPVAFSVVPPPKITRIAPATAARGTTVEVLLSGTNLDLPSEWTIKVGNDITVSNVRVISSTSVGAIFTIASDAIIGEHGVTVTVAGWSGFAGYFKVVPPGQPKPFTLVDRGGVRFATSGLSSTLNIGYAEIEPSAGATPAAFAIFGLRQNGVLVSEAGVPASPLIRSGRMFAELNATVNTGLAIANPNPEPVTISLSFTDSRGGTFRRVSSIPAFGQIAKFMDQLLFIAQPPVSGALTFSSTVPVAVIALRALTNERSELIITTLPVLDLDTPAPLGPIILPHFADGGGSATQIALVNPRNTTLTGTVQFLDPSGSPLPVTINQQTSASFAYSIPPFSSQKLQTSGAAGALQTGSVRILPSGGNNAAAPTGVLIFSVRASAVTVSEAGVPVNPAGTAFRFYAETGPDGAIQTGIAIANISPRAVGLSMELYNLDGSSTGLIGNLSLPPNGQTAIFLNQIPGLTSLPMPFQGIVRLSSTEPVSAMSIRGRYNERNDFLITTTPVFNEAATASSTPTFFPHVVDSEGGTTQFVLFSGYSGQASSGTLRFFSQTGEPWTVPVQ